MRVRVFLNHLGSRIPVGILAQTERGILFEYHPDFLERGIPFSPYLLPLRPGPSMAFSESSTIAFPTAGACSCLIAYWPKKGVPLHRSVR